MRRLTFALVLVLGHSALAKARSQPAPNHLDYRDDEVVEAPTHGPSGDVVAARRRALSPSLIRVREDFRREMLRSIDAL